MTLGLALIFWALVVLLGSLAVVMALDSYREARAITRRLRSRRETPPRPPAVAPTRTPRPEPPTDPAVVTHDDVLGLIPPSIRHKFRTPRA